MSKENKAVVRRMIEEIFNQGNLDATEEIVAQDHVHHDPAMPEEGHCIEGFKQFVGLYRLAFPDLHVQIEDQFAEADRVATRWTATGTHEGDLMDIPSTGRRATQPDMDISRISGGKIAGT